MTLALSLEQSWGLVRGSGRLREVQMASQLDSPGVGWSKKAGCRPVALLENCQALPFHDQTAGAPSRGRGQAVETFLEAVGGGPYGFVPALPVASRSGLYRGSNLTMKAAPPEDQ